VAYRNRSRDDGSDLADDEAATSEKRTYDETLGRAIFSVLLWDPPYPAPALLKAQGPVMHKRLRRFFDSVVQVTPSTPARRRVTNALADLDGKDVGLAMYTALFGEVPRPTELAPLDEDERIGEAHKTPYPKSGWHRMRFHDDDRAALARWAGATPGVLRSWSAEGGRSGNAMDDLALFLSWAVLRKPDDKVERGVVPVAAPAFLKTPEEAIQRIWGEPMLEQAAQSQLRHIAAGGPGAPGIELVRFYPPQARLIAMTIARGHASESDFLIKPAQAWSIWRALIRGICERPDGADQDTPTPRFRLSAGLMADEIIPILYPDWVCGAEAVPDSFVRETDRLLDDDPMTRGTLSHADQQAVSKALVAGRDKIALTHLCAAEESTSSIKTPEQGNGWRTDRKHRAI
jgi:hypothetical protein